jgi:hypothetical protein
VGLDAAPVVAECPYLPPWPRITTAIPSAREIVVGQVVTDFTLADLDLKPETDDRDYALRVTHVLRGNAHVGDLLDVQYMLPNWPQTRFRSGSEEGTISSCTHLPAAPGEVIALAFDALHPGGPMRSGDLRWVQPPTRYNAVGVIEAKSSRWEREHVTLSQLRALAAMPPTDADQVLPSFAPAPGSAPLAWIAGLIGFWLAIRRFGAHRRFGSRSEVSRADMSAVVTQIP